MRDAVELEWAGIPAVAIVHEAFSLAASATADTSGLSDCAWVEIRYPHTPPGEWSPDEVQALAAIIAPAVLAHLTH